LSTIPRKHVMNM